jgi:hypothetical protein
MIGLETAHHMDIVGVIIFQSFQLFPAAKGISIQDMIEESIGDIGGVQICLMIHLTMVC